MAEVLTQQGVEEFFQLQMQHDFVVRKKERRTFLVSVELEEDTGHVHGYMVANHAGDKLHYVEGETANFQFVTSSLPPEWQAKVLDDGRDYALYEARPEIREMVALTDTKSYETP